MKTLIDLIGSALCMIIILLLLTYSCEEDKIKYEQDRKTLAKELGTKVVIHKDTLVIVDYTITMQQYKLSDGRWINAELVSKIKIKP